MSTQYNIKLELDTKPFAEGPKSALNTGRIYHTQFSEIATGMRINIDTIPFDKEIASLEKRNRELREDLSVPVILDANGNPLKREADTARIKIKYIPNNKTTTFHGNITPLIWSFIKTNWIYTTENGKKSVFYHSRLRIFMVNTDRIREIAEKHFSTEVELRKNPGYVPGVYDFTLPGRPFWTAYEILPYPYVGGPRFVIIDADTGKIIYEGVDGE